MPIYIYNSLARKKEEFIPLNPSEIKMYVCGPTVYDQPHIGHARSAYIFDFIRHYLEYKGYKVKFVRNVTDVDDKIIDRARKDYQGEDLNTSFKKIADKYLAEYHDALNKLEIKSSCPLVIEPKASEYIEKMIRFIESLISKEAAYPSGGDVYFDITKALNYGKLSHQSLDKMEIGARVSSGENKKNPLDFALWKSAKVGEPSWDSPWGKGRPGWHIECSVMSSDILGDEFDIHGGGLDLIFPHHENEIAQSEGAGKKFARFWIHHGLLTINGQKMSKSLGNFITINDFIGKYEDATILKLFFLSTHYSHPIDYTEEKIKDSLKQTYIFSDFFNKIDTWKQFYDYWMSDAELVAMKNKAKGEFTEKEKNNVDTFCLKFEQSMEDDFNTPQALGYLFEIVNLGLNFVSSDKEKAFTYVESRLEKLLDNFGLKFKRIKKLSEEDLKKIAKSEIARMNKNFNESDNIRQEFKKLGLAISNTASNITITEIRLKDG